MFPRIRPKLSCAGTGEYSRRMPAITAAIRAKLKNLSSFVIVGRLVAATWPLSADPDSSFIWNLEPTSRLICPYGLMGTGEQDNSWAHNATPGYAFHIVTTRRSA